MGCAVNSHLVDLEYPFECARDLMFPGNGCRVGSLGTNFQVYKMVSGAAGREPRDPLISMSSTLKSFKCCTDNSMSHGTWTVEHMHGSFLKPAYVTGVFHCDGCFKFGVNFGVSWRQVLETKYESQYLAGCAVAYFISRKTNYMPKVIIAADSHLAVGRVRLFYHKAIESTEEQTLDLSLDFRDGGWHIRDPLKRNCFPQVKACLQCKFTNANSDGSRMMFGLDCKKHALCEKCVFSYYAKYTTIGDGGADVNGRECDVCKQKLQQALHVSLAGVGMLRAPWPVGFIGKKAVFSTALFDNLCPFYERSVKWAVDAMEEAENESRGADTALEGLVEDRREEDENTSEDLSRRRLEAIRSWKAALEAWQQVMMWLNSKKEHYAFLLEFDVPFSKHFLDKDAYYFIIQMDKKSFDRLRQKAECATDRAVEVSADVEQPMNEFGTEVHIFHFG